MPSDGPLASLACPDEAHVPNISRSARSGEHGPRILSSTWASMVQSGLRCNVKTAIAIEQVSRNWMTPQNCAGADVIRVKSDPDKGEK